jgi:hypothetical protein
MAVDGTWALTMNTPLGERQATVTLNASGGALTGTQSAEGQTGEIYEGSVSGDDVTWKIDITDPMSMTLEFAGTVQGDSISGQMKAGFYGSWPFSGQRA